MAKKDETDLEALQSRIKKAETKFLPDAPQQEERIDGMRIVTELVAGVAVGSFLGYHLDKFFNTSPIFFIICFFLGVAGGAFTIYKLACRSDKQEESA